MEIRKANLQDLEGLSLIWKELMDFHKEYHPIFVLAPEAKELILHILKAKIEKPDTCIFICLDGAEITGMLIASYTEGSEAFVLHKKGYVAETVVQERYRGRGIGKKLYERAEQWLREKGADHIELQVSVNNRAAKQFWEEKGFSPSSYRMIKNL